MMRNPRDQSRHRKCDSYSAKCQGFTMIEAVMSIIIVGIMYVAALQTVASSRITEAITADNRRGHELAQQLLAEITPLPYWDPVNLAGLGPNTTEQATGNRSLFNDVDDYNNWSASPPKRKDGSTIAGFDEWTRTVKVVWVEAANPSTVRSSETNFKRITVTVKRRDKVVATMIALRGNAD